MGSCCDHERLSSRRKPLARYRASIPRARSSSKPRPNADEPPTKVAPPVSPSDLAVYIPLKPLSKPLHEKYLIVKELPRTTSGICNFAIHRATKLPRLIRRTPRSEEKVREIEDELQCLYELDHPMILRQYELTYDESCFYVISEVVPGKGLVNWRQICGSQQEDVKVNILIQLLEGICYYHNRGIIHGNLCPSTVLFCDTTTNLATLIIKLIGFALKRQGPEENLNSLNSPILYSAPEVMNGGRYTEKADIWSCAALMYTLYTGETPFFAQTKRKFCGVLGNPKVNFGSSVWRNVHPEVISLLTSMLSPNLADRPSAHQCLQNSWLLSQKPPLTSRKIVTSTLYNLLKFKSAQKEQMRILSVISMNVLTSEEKEQLTQVFRKFDLDKDTRLAVGEIMEAMKVILPVSKAQEAAERVMEILDLDENGYLDFSEFVIAATDLSVLLSDRRLKVAFDLFDENKSGTISVTEFRNVLKVGANSELFDKLIRVVDKNNDGELSFGEFTRLVKLIVGEAVSSRVS